MIQSSLQKIENKLNVLKTYTGKTATGFLRADYMTDGVENNEHFGPLQISFSDQSFLTLDENGDAESISISTTAIWFGRTEADRETYWKEITLNQKEPWIDFVGCKLENVSLLIDSSEERSWACGCKLSFDNGKSFAYLNWYDDAKVSFSNDTLLERFIEHGSLKVMD